MITEIHPDSAAAVHGSAGFGPENLPYGSFAGHDGVRRLGVRIGDHVADAAAVLRHDAGASDAALAAASGEDLGALLAAGRTVWTEVRAALRRALGAAGSAEALAGVLHPLASVTLHLPFAPADYVDFYASEHHASNVGRIFRPEQEPLLPNWRHLPIGYHGRSGTIVPSGTGIVRPKGLRPEKGGAPSFGPSRKLDIEAEMGFVLGGSAPAGEVALGDAGEHIFGMVLVNDWSARDIQAFEYVPLGPFLGKSFGTSVGAWVVPVEALDAARVPPPERVVPLADYLDDAGATPWGFDVSLRVTVDGTTVSRPPFAQMYWTGAQMLAHMTVNGATVRPGDFYASGTVSGPEAGERGSFLEMSWGGRDSVRLDAGEMTFLEDGQTVSIGGSAPGPGGSTISFGEAVGSILPAT